jgi:hypothetical protein
MNPFSFSATTAKTVTSAFTKAAKAEESALIARNKAGQKMVDELTLAAEGDKAKFWEKSKARAACVALFSECPGLSEGAVKNYPTSVKLAFIHGLDFTASLYTNQGKKAAGLPVKEKADTTAKAGKVTSTTRVELDKTLSKAIAQARLIKLEGFAADLVDLCVESLADFKEVTE